MDALYTFVYRGLLTDESLDKVGRRRRRHFGAEEAAKIRQSLSFEMLDPDCLADAERRAIVYTAIHAFENTVRELVKKAMAEAHGETWWTGGVVSPEQVTELHGVRKFGSVKGGLWAGFCAMKKPRNSLASEFMVGDTPFWIVI
jgi:hypothetical protein